MTPIQILRYYYGNDIELATSNNIGEIRESYPGYALRLGNNSDAVRTMQNYLNRIRVNYPLIPLIPNPNGLFGTDTLAAVQTFQRTFNLPADGIIGRATWNRIVQIFVAVTRLAELDSEGLRATIGENPPTAVLTVGSRGQNVLELQFILNYLSVFYPSIPPVIEDGVFGPSLRSAVMDFQRAFGLTPDGVVGPTTWKRLYSVYRGIDENVTVPQPPGGTTPPPYPGTPLRFGSSGLNVRTMQNYLNTIRTVYPSIPQLAVDGDFGSATRDAVIEFQRIFGLTPDGVIGPVTWNAIVERYGLISAGKPTPPVTPPTTAYPGTPLRAGVPKNQTVKQIAY